MIADETNDIINNVIGVSKDGSNRIGQKHLEETINLIRAKAPIKKGTLVSQLRIKLLIGERYVMEYLDGLVAYEIIKIEKGIVIWNFKGIPEPQAAEIPTSPNKQHEALLKIASKQIYDRKEKYKQQADSPEGIPFSDIQKLTPFCDLGFTPEEFETWFLVQIEG